MTSLAESKQSLYDRVRKDTISFQPSGLLRSIYHPLAVLLAKLGITFPILYLIPNVMKENFSRQGYLTVPPGASFSWHFDATKASVLVIRRAEFYPLDISSSNILTYTFTHPQAQAAGPINFVTLASESGQKPSYPITPVVDSSGPAPSVNVATTTHPGMRKGLILILDRSQQSDLTLKNTSSTAPAFCKFNIMGWYV